MNEKPPRYCPRKIRWLKENKTPTGSLAKEWPEWRASTQRWQEVMTQFLQMDLRHVVGWEDKYLVSSCGRIFSRHGEAKAFFAARDYRSIKLVRSVECQTTKLVHRLIALAFIPNPVNKPFVNHKNGIPYDNRVENLEWVTPKENAVHAIAVLGRYGSTRPGIKLLSHEEIREIFRLFGLGMSQLKLGKIFKRSASNIAKILRGESYPHLTQKLLKESNLCKQKS